MWSVRHLGTETYASQVRVRCVLIFRIECSKRTFGTASSSGFLRGLKFYERFEKSTVTAPQGYSGRRLRDGWLWKVGGNSTYETSADKAVLRRCQATRVHAQASGHLTRP